jgi:CheY-like chemotaxis protein
LQILLAEDNEINQKMTRVLLVRQGYEVQLAGNGLEAIEAVRSKKFDLIFMDVQMPEMDGLEAAQKIREMEGETRQIPIIAMTAHALQGDRQRCMDAGMDDYVSKPLDPRKVFQAIERWTSPDIRGVIAETKLEERLRPLEQLESDARQVSAEPQPDVVLDVESALIRFSNDRDFYVNLLDDFVLSLEVRVNEMKAALESADAQALSYLAHNMKGVSANFSAVQLARLATAMDDCCRVADLETAGRLMLDVETAADMLRARIIELKQDEEQAE